MTARSNHAFGTLCWSATAGKRCLVTAKCWTGRWARVRLVIWTAGAIASVRTKIRGAWPGGAAGYALLAVLGAGLALRVVTVVSWWPVTITTDDAYEVYAGSNPFRDPLHPAGYELIVAALGAVTRNVAFTVSLQHLTGFGSALLLWAATRRLTGSPWPGLLPAVFVLLNPDLIYLEHGIMSESWSILVMSFGLYAAVRAFDQPIPWWGWPLACGAAIGAAATIRSANLLLIAVVVLALLLYRGSRLTRWAAPATAAATAAFVLFVYANANATFATRFAIGPSSGWIAYGAASQFADCTRFTPPQGTRVLRETRPSAKRPGSYYYLFDPNAPAPRAFGSFGAHDDLVGAFARRAIRAQPGDYLRMTWTFLHSYWVPDSAPDRPDLGGDVKHGFIFTRSNPFIAAAIHQRLEGFYRAFNVKPWREGLRFLNAWRPFTRFGSTGLVITTILTLIGLCIGTRRSRAGVLLFGVGGIAVILPAALTASYSARYIVPMAGPMMVAAAIALTELWRMFSARTFRSRPQTHRSVRV